MFRRGQGSAPGGAGFGRLLLAVCVAQGTAILGFDFCLPFMPLYLQHDLGVHGLGQTAIWAGVIGFGPAIPATVFGPIWGKVADRYGYRRMLLRAMVCASALLALMGLAQTLWMLLVLRMVQGALTGTIFSAQALVAASAPEKETGRAMGMLQMSVYAGATLGPVAGGLVAQIAGYRATFLTSGVLLAMATLVVFAFVSEPEHLKRSQRSRESVSLAELLRMPMFVAAVGFTVLSQFVASSQYPILPLFVQNLLHGTGSVAGDTGWLLALSGLAAAGGAYAAGRLHREYGLAGPLLVAGGVGIVLLMAQGAAPSYTALLAIRCASACSFGALFALVGVWAAAASPPRAKGVAFGWIGAASSMGFGAGPLIGGLVVSAAGIRAAFVLAGLFLLIPWTATAIGGRSLIPGRRTAVPPEGSGHTLAAE